MRYLSPLRYPGGKGSFARFLEDVIDLNDLRGCQYFEPFAGGAAAALALLRKNAVSVIHINDADYRVFAFWRSALEQSERFADRIGSVPLNMEQWRIQRDICESPRNHDLFNVGFAAFFMNRCNRSGVLTGAGPIGGYQQSGKWRLDVRFPRDGLVERILQMGRMRKRIRVTGMDAIRFLSEKLPLGGLRRRALVFLDPPYVAKGQRLYLNAYEKRDHRRLSRYLLAQKVLPWIMSYDFNPLVQQLYSSCRQALLPIRYTLHKKRNAEELIIAPNRTTFPKTFRTGTGGLPLSKTI